jgi:predicted phage terminase large subunit-like protein
MSKGKLKIPKSKVTKQDFRLLTQQATEAVQQLRAAAQVASDALKAGRSGFTEADGTREERLARTMFSALEFGRVYLPHYFESESAPFHEALDKVLTGDFTDKEAQEWRDKYGIEVHRGDPDLNLTAIEIARGHGKSVIANLCDSLRRICHGLDPYQIIGGDTFAQAGAQLEDIKDELASNDKIKADFGSLKPQKGTWKEVELIQREDGRVMWREGSIITTNNVRVDALGRGGKMRGRRHGAQRPTCFTGDDLDNDENVVTKDQRDKAWNWVMSAVIPAMDPKRGIVRIIGTTIHFDCTIARASRKTDEEGKRIFTSIKFPAMRRNQKNELVSNWPARFPTAKLLKIRGLLGPTKFGAEYMNDPRDPETQIFNPNRFQYVSVSELHSKPLSTFLYVDPSKGKKGKGRKKSDFSGFAKGLVDKAARVTNVVDAFRKRLSPNAAKSFVIDWYIKALEDDPNAELYVEENSFGDILGENFQDELRARGIDKPVKTLLHTTEKEARLERLSIRIETGGVRFNNKWEQEDRRPDWFSEFEDFPAGSYDDTIDAIESLDEIASKSVPAASAGKDPEGGNSRERMQADKEARWLAKIKGFGRLRRAA